MFGKIFQSVGNYFGFFFNSGCVTSLKRLANWPVTSTLWASLIKRRLLSSDDDTFFPLAASPTTSVPIFTWEALTTSLQKHHKLFRNLAETNLGSG